MQPRCRHCARKKPHSRGLCVRCFGDLAIRDQYPPRKPGGRNTNVGANNPDITEAELDALIAEMRPTMPDRRYEDD